MRIITSVPEGLPGEIDSLNAVRPRIFGPAIDVEILLAQSRHGKGRAELGISLDCLPEQIECSEYSPFFPRVSMRKGTQVEVVSGQIIGRPFTGSADLSGL